MKKLLAVVMLCLLAGTAYAGEDVVVAKVGDKEIRMSDFDRMISHYDAEKKQILDQQPQLKAVILQRFVQGMVLSKIARDNGFDKSEGVQEALRLLENDYLASEYLRQEVMAKVQVTDEDKRLYYKTHQEEFRVPEMVKVRHILVKSERTEPEAARKAAREKAEDLLKKIRAGEDFGALAQEFSDDIGSKAKGGELGLLPKGRMTPEFEKISFSLKPGEVSDVIETPAGFEIIEVEEKRDGFTEPYDKVEGKVKDAVFNELKKARLNEFVEKAMKDAKVEINLDPFQPKK